MPASGASKASWPPFMGLWKSRLPAIVVPVLAGLRSLPQPHSNHGFFDRYPYVELVILAAIAGTTGYARLPFSVTWWLVLLAAFALETQLLLGAAACLSLSILLGWYGVRLCHPQAVSALWGGTRRYAADDSASKGGVSPWARACWQAWDLFVHALPAALVLYWHGPAVDWDGTVSPGTATPVAVSAALSMNVIWLWGLGFGLQRREGDVSPSCKRLWPVGMRLAETNRVYCVAPELPQGAWLWIYGSHWIACGVWLSCLLLPKQVLFAFGIFSAFGLIRMPYTNAWWTLFLFALYSYFYADGAYPMVEGICACCAATTAAGFYGTQLLAPYAFKALVRAWVILPVQRLGPRWLSEPLARFSETTAFMVAARASDFFIHALPTSTAVYLFRHNVTSGAALAALPTNLMYMVAMGSKTFAECNKVYGVVPPLSDGVWNYIFGSHWLICSLVLFVCLLADSSAAAHEAAAVAR